MIEGERLHEALGCQPGPAAEQVVQFVGRDGGGIGHRLDGRLHAPVFGDECDRATNGVVVAQRGVLEARLGEAKVMYDERHHAG
jgi:hypothetical protein